MKHTGTEEKDWDFYWLGPKPQDQRCTYTQVSQENFKSATCNIWPNAPKLKEII